MVTLIFERTYRVAQVSELSFNGFEFELSPISPPRCTGSYFFNVISHHNCKANDSGFLASSLVVAVIIIAVQHSLSSGKNLSAIRVVLTSIFLLNVALFVGGQTASMTVTAVSDACGSTNALLTVADQLARVSSLILGLNIVARIRFDLARYGLYVWTVARLSTRS